MAYRGSFSFGFGLTPWVKNLIIANVAIFMVDYMLGGLLRAYFQLVPALALYRPWTVVSYMFLHGDFMHIFFNMLGLFFFGPPLEQRWGSATFLKFYFITGIAGAVLAFIFIPSSAIIGASGAVYGVMAAFALFWPDSPIYIWGILPVPAKYLIGLFVVISLLSTIRPSGGNIAHAVHLGGAVAAFIFIKVNAPGGAFGGFRKMMNKRKLKVVSYDDSSSSRPATVTRPASTSATGRRRPAGSAEEEKLLDELDRVLEKISTQGMSSLTTQERKLLDEVSRKYRTD